MEQEQALLQLQSIKDLLTDILSAQIVSTAISLCPSDIISENAIIKEMDRVTNLISHSNATQIKNIKNAR